MTPRNPVVRKSGSPGREPDPAPRKLLSVRSALILTLAVLAGLVSAVLLYAAHRPDALVALGGGGICAPALKFFDWLIELRPFRSLIHVDARGLYPGHLL